MHSSSRKAESSPLLRLPGEVREQILLNLVRKQKVHILHVVLVRPEKMNKAPWGWRGPYNCSSRLPSGYHHCVCGADMKHNECVTEHPSSAIILTEADHELSHQFCEMRQRTWHTNKNGETIAQKLGWSQINISILRASCQLYEEANYLLWKNTTFAFSDRDSLEAFLQDLKDMQTASLQHLELSATASTWHIWNGANGTDDDSFASTRFGELSKMLSEIGSLTSLNLHLTYRTHSPAFGKTIMTRQINDGLMCAFRDLSRLDVQHINVCVRERAANTPVFTLSELEQLAFNFREKLLTESKTYRTSGKDRWTCIGLESRPSQQGAGSG